MKKFLRSVILCVCVTLTVRMAATAQSKLIHFWHFNNYTMADSSTPTHTIAGIAADYSTIDVNKAKILYAKLPSASPYYFTRIDSIYPIATDFDTVNVRMSAAQGLALRVRNPSDSMKLLFYVPTTHYKNIKLTYGSQSSSTTRGQLHQVFDYSVDSGLTWKTSGLSMASDSAWLIYHRTTVTFTTDTTVNNNSKLVFRITFNGNDTGSKGNNRFDNVSVDGDTIVPAGFVSPVVSALSYVVYPNPASNMLHISSEIDGSKNIVISNVEGKVVLSASVTGKQFPVDISALQTGVYMLTISDERTGSTETKQFIKQ